MSAVLPALSIFLAVLATGIPWGLPADATFILPFVVLMLVFCWRAMPHAVLPPVAALMLGLLTDVLTGGPLGFFGLMALMTSSVGARMRPMTKLRGLDQSGLAWAPLVLALAGLAWLLASLFFLRWVDWWPLFLGAVGSIALLPATLYVLLKLSGGGFVPRRRTFYGARA